MQSRFCIIVYRNATMIYYLQQMSYKTYAKDASVKKYPETKNGMLCPPVSFHSERHPDGSV